MTNDTPQSSRRELAYRFRVGAARLARDRHHPEHRANADEVRYASARYAMSFTKGLEHDECTGLLANPAHFEAFRKAIDEAHIDAFTLNVPVSGANGRQWEAPTAGVVFDLQGPDAQAVTMSPAPPLGSLELAYEMAEVYELALLRDVPLTEFLGCSPVPNTPLCKPIKRLNNLGYTQAKPAAGCPRRPRKTDAKGNINHQTAFRGSSPGVEVGPYLSQFLLIGTADQPGCTSVADGKITYGALQVDQRVPVAPEGADYMTNWCEWLKVQNGADTQNDRALFKKNDQTLFEKNQCRRFISTPRDLATYVHYDALYQAYLNACLILLALKAPTDPAFDNLSGAGKLQHLEQAPTRRAGGFALFGGPHILTLVTEVATRALKAVRYQKFNVHLRLRPEALAGRIEKSHQIGKCFPHIGKAFSKLGCNIKATVNAVREFNTSAGKTALLPMAFQEGSPMHPSYGAGHAVVAGACVTILKAFFDTSAVFVQRKGDKEDIGFKRYQQGDKPVAYVPNDDGSKLKLVDVANPEGGDGACEPAMASSKCPTSCGCHSGFLTLEGELNKLAANISIGRNMAGVHYFSDYYDSLRLGESVALGILEEQALGYGPDPFILTVPTFDGKLVRIGSR